MIRMQKKPFVFAVFFTIILFGCSGNASKEEHKEVKSASESAYKIIFSLGGDDFASQQDFATINKIKARVAARGIADVLSTGSGMGYITMVFKLHKENPLDSIKDIVREVYPEAAYRIEPIETVKSGLAK